MIVVKPTEHLKKPVMVRTFIGDLEVESIYHNSLGFHAVTGEGLNQKTWNITAKEYKDLEKQLEARKSGQNID